MIYIFSEKNDTTTNEVIDWLEYYGEAYTRINKDEDEALYEQLSKSLVNASQSIKKGHVGNEKVDAFWFRRPDQQIMKRLVTRSQLNEEDVMYPEFPEESSYWKSWQEDLQVYNMTYYQSLLDDAETKIGNYKKTNLNKVQVLKIANRIGIDIPDTLVTNDLSKLGEFFESHNRNIICKSLYEIVYPIGVKEAGFLLRCLTQAITGLATLPKAFYPSLFQENIEKKYELRVYYLDGKFYSTAMFTQLNEKTKQDFRNYDSERPTRIVPYKLDDELEAKLHLLMQAVSLDNGSLDLMKGIDGKYYFLEINPVGQYGFISNPANYYLGKLNAELLIKKQYPQRNLQAQ